MQVLIVGTGAEGAWIGSRLIQSGVGTTFLVGTKERAAELDRHGMVVRSSGDFFQSRVHAITYPEISQAFDAVIIASRAHKSSFALASARQAIGPSTVVLPLRFDPIQLSILSEEQIGITVCGVPTMTVKQLRDGSVSHGGNRTSLSIGMVFCHYWTCLPFDRCCLRISKKSSKAFANVTPFDFAIRRCSLRMSTPSRAACRIGMAFVRASSKLTLGQTPRPRSTRRPLIVSRRTHRLVLEGVMTSLRPAPSS